MKQMIRSIKLYKPSPAVITLSLLCMVGTLAGCRKMFDLPEEKEFLSQNVNYGSKLIEPIIGRNNLIGQFNSDNSSLPLTFEIVNARYGDGRPVTDLFQTQPTLVWTAAYDGFERSLQEIEAKRKIEERPLFEVRQSGQFILWGSSTNDLIEPRPTDSSNLVQDIRYFDLKVSNTGGEVLLRDFQVMVWRERPYFPSTDINPYTGGPAPDPDDPLNPNKRAYIMPRSENVIGADTDRPIRNDNEVKDLVVYIRPFEGGSGNNLRFVFLGPDNTPLNPALFNETKWDNVVHGFNRVTTAEYVQYDVAYPIPLVNTQTRYTTSDGSNAQVEFGYSRRGFGGALTYATFGLDFSIYRAGDWEVVFHFRNQLPKFDNE